MYSCSLQLHTSGVLLFHLDIDMCHVPDVHIHTYVQLYHATAVRRYAPLRTHIFLGVIVLSSSSTSTPVSAPYPRYPSGYMSTLLSVDMLTSCCQGYSWHLSVFDSCQIWTGTYNTYTRLTRTAAVWLYLTTNTTVALAAACATNLTPGFSGAVLRDIYFVRKYQNVYFENKV